MEFFVTCAAGFEPLLADELRALRVPQVRPLRGQVGFGGGVADAYRVCLWSRLASRVVAVLARIGARDADELYAGVYGIAWEDQLPVGASVAVGAHGTNAALRNTQFTALRTKDAIADRIADRAGRRLATDPAHPDLRIVVRLSRERAVIGVDLAGDPLFHRGVTVPLRPDYAAAMLAAGGWHRLCREGTPALVALGDGAPVLLAEAAAQATDSAPGLLRPRWGFERWGLHDEAAWSDLLAEADDRAEAGQAVAERALLIDVSQPGADLPDLHDARTLVACDLSWLHADDAAREAAELGRAREALAAVDPASSLVTLARTGLAGIDAGKPSFDAQVFIGGDEGTLRAYGLSPSAEAEDSDAAGAAAADSPASASGPNAVASDAAPSGIASASIAGSTVALKDGRQVPVLLAQSDQFARRLEKVWRLRRKWARREDMGCFRVYDADLPDYAVAVDYFRPSELLDERAYGGTGGGPWATVAEYAAPKDVDPALARRRLLDALAISAPVLGVTPDNVSLRVRTRAKGGSQYADRIEQKKDARSARGGRDSSPNRTAGRDRSSSRPGADAHLALPRGAHLIDEGGLTFEVNFSAGLDYGLFLDTRDVRARIREMAKATAGSKRFLNLFAYTGSATVYAADGGAKHTTTVDLSRPYLDWARRNMERNGFSGDAHEYVQADVLAWVTEQRHTANRWDLIYLDPPTFSNSSRMRAASFDIQRDHAELLIGVSRLLTRAGTCVFCCNLRDFKPDEAALAKAGVALEDITAQTIPEDFARNQKVHHCYLVRRV